MWLNVIESVHDHKKSHVHLGYAKCLEIMTVRIYFQGMANLSASNCQLQK